MTYLDTVRGHYPDAQSTDDLVERFLAVAESRLGLPPRQLLAADSICSDDLNSIQYPRRASEMLGPFKLGGLNGFPFAGLTGMNAFAHHVPEDGAVFVYFGPHVGISRDGTLGRVRRPGQTTGSACCGAAVAALDRLAAGTLAAAPPSELDYQLNTIEQLFLAERDRILGSPQPLREATEVMYEATERRIELLAGRTAFPCKHVLLAGGILINGDDGSGSFVALRRFDCLTLATGARLDLLPDL